MKATVMVTVAVATCLLLALWRPPIDSSRRWIRDYLLLITSLGFVVVGLSRLLRAVGLGEFATGFAPMLLAIGLVTAIGAATKAPLYWRVVSSWGVWANLSEGWRQALNVVAGIVIVAGGLTLSGQERTAHRICRSWYAMAHTSADSAAVDGSVPDPHLRPPRARFAKAERPPMTCRRLYK